MATAACRRRTLHFIFCERRPTKLAAKEGNAVARAKLLLLKCRDASIDLRLALVVERGMNVHAHAHVHAQHVHVHACACA